MRRIKHLLDINVVVALMLPEHPGFQAATEWFDPHTLDWGLCAFSQAGFLRLIASPHVGKLTVDEANQMLATLVELPGYRFWPINDGWGELVAPFRESVWGHQQITDAYLLGLAIQENGVLVTLDKAIKHMAGPKFGKHVLVLES